MPPRAERVDPVQRDTTPYTTVTPRTRSSAAHALSATNFRCYVPSRACFSTQPLHLLAASPPPCAAKQRAKAATSRRKGVFCNVPHTSWRGLAQDTFQGHRVRTRPQFSPGLCTLRSDTAGTGGVHARWAQPRLVYGVSSVRRRTAEAVLRRKTAPPADDEIASRWGLPERSCWRAVVQCSLCGDQFVALTNDRTGAVFARAGQLTLLAWQGFSSGRARAVRAVNTTGHAVQTGVNWGESMTGLGDLDRDGGDADPPLPGRARIKSWETYRVLRCFVACRRRARHGRGKRVPLAGQGHDHADDT